MIDYASSFIYSITIDIVLRNGDIAAIAITELRFLYKYDTNHKYFFIKKKHNRRYS